MNKSIKVFAVVSALFFMLDASLLAGGVSGSENESGQGDEASIGAGKRERTERGRGPRPDDAGRGRSAGDRGGFQGEADRFGEEWGSGATGRFPGMDEGADRGY